MPPKKSKYTKRQKTPESSEEDESSTSEHLHSKASKRKYQVVEQSTPRKKAKNAPAGDDISTKLDIMMSMMK